MSFRRMIPFLLLNVLVSATVVLVILWWWDGRSPQARIDSPGIQDESSLADLLPPLGAAPQPTAQSPADASEPAVEAETAVETAGNLTGEQTHTVRAGDTLGRISGQYGVAIETIMEANGMANPNFLSVGQELIIPNLSGIPTPIPTLSNAEATESTGSDAPPPPIPTVPAGEGVANVEVTAVVNAGLFASEFVEIVNSGNSEINLAGWQVRDQSGKRYTFGSITLFGEGAGIQLHTGSGQNSATDLYWDQDVAIWQAGAVVQLTDADDNIIAEFTVP